MFDRIPQWLKERPTGNYRGALELGATVHETSLLESGPVHPAVHADTFKNLKHCLVLEEGGRSVRAEQGVAQLAKEIISWSRHLPEPNLTVALPSGTGTTALYLHKHLKPVGIEVITCACVGGSEYLVKQWEELGEEDFPTILQPEHKHHFAKLYKQDFEIWKQLQEETHIEFDLLYDPLMWRCLLEWRANNPHKQLLYIHQGGILGNESMLPRYQRKYEDPACSW